MANHNQAKQSAQQPSTEKKYFNVTSKGLGFLNKVEVKQSTGRDDSVKVSVAGLMGPDDGVEYERYQLYVRGTQALKVIESLRQHITEENKVTISFSASNCRAKAFVSPDGDNVGKLITYQSGSLIFISSARVNGEEVFRAPERQED